MSDRVAVDGLGVEVADGDGPVALVAHGAGSSARFVVEAFAAPLARAGWRLAAVDLRGHAGSRPARSVADHALDVHAGDLVAVAEHVGARVVGGVSLGGMAAVRAAASLDVDAVLAVIPAWSGRAEGGPHAVVADEVRHVGVAGMVARLEADPDLPGWIREVVLRDYARHDVASLEAALRSLDGGEAPTLDEVAALDVPLAVVGWPDDPGHPIHVARAWAEVARQGALVETSIAAMQDDRTAFGAAAVRALQAVGVRPRGADA